jgi:hypothetical protein
MQGTPIIYQLPRKQMPRRQNICVLARQRSVVLAIMAHMLCGKESALEYIDI